MSEFRKYLNEERGRGREIAIQLGVSSAAVSQWADIQVPAERVFKISEITGIPVQKLRPDLLTDQGRAA